MREALRQVARIWRTMPERVEGGVRDHLLGWHSPVDTDDGPKCTAHGVRNAPDWPCAEYVRISETASR